MSEEEKEHRINLGKDRAGKMFSYQSFVKSRTNRTNEEKIYQQKFQLNSYFLIGVNM